VRYLLYGCRIRSNRPIPGLIASSSDAVDLDVEFDRLPPPASEEPGIYASPSLRVSRTPRGYRFVYEDAQFLVADSGDRVIAATSPGSSFEDTCTYLVGPVMGFALRLRGAVCLHASVVVAGGSAVALCGPPGAGKSSSAAGFAQRGCAVLAEDMAALQENGDGFLVQPGYPRVNLWPDAAAALGGDGDALPAITPNWEKRYLPLASGVRADVPSFHCDPAPLTAIYILEGRGTALEAAFRPLKPMEALLALAANTYSWYLLDSAMRAREFDVLRRLVRAVPVRAVSAPDDFAGIGLLCDGILADLGNAGAVGRAY